MSTHGVTITASLIQVVQPAFSIKTLRSCSVPLLDIVDPFPHVQITVKECTIMFGGPDGSKAIGTEFTRLT